jgi:hypothetical protein
MKSNPRVNPRNRSPHRQRTPELKNKKTQTWERRAEAELAQSQQSAPRDTDLGGRRKSARMQHSTGEAGFCTRTLQTKNHSRIFTFGGGDCKFQIGTRSTTLPRESWSPPKIGNREKYLSEKNESRLRICARNRVATRTCRRTRNAMENQKQTQSSKPDRDLGLRARTGIRRSFSRRLTQAVHRRQRLKMKQAKPAQGKTK